MKTRDCAITQKMLRTKFLEVIYGVTVCASTRLHACVSTVLVIIEVTLTVITYNTIAVMKLSLVTFPFDRLSLSIICVTIISESETTR